MILINSETYYELKTQDLINLKCDKCFKLYKKSKKSWYYNTYDRKNKILNFQAKTYCSKECFKSRYEINNRTYNCFHCNKEFEGKINENSKFCSHSCSAIFNNNKRNGNKIVNCVDCNIEFKVWKYLTQKKFRCELCKIKRNNAIKVKTEELKNKVSICKFCSNAFKNVGRKKYYCSKECIKNNKKKYVHVCIGCDIIFKSSEKDSKYCSNSCKSINLNLSKYAHMRGGKSRSKIEFYIEDKLKSDFPNIKFIFNDKETIGSELDVYIPELKIAIEINGIVHYEPIYGEEKLIKIQNKDKQKIINCHNLNIQLITIPLGKSSLSKKQTEEIYQKIFESIKIGLSR